LAPSPIFVETFPVPLSPARWGCTVLVLFWYGFHTKVSFHLARLIFARRSGFLRAGVFFLCAIRPAVFLDDVAFPQPLLFCAFLLSSQTQKCSDPELADLCSLPLRFAIDLHAAPRTVQVVLVLRCQTHPELLSFCPYRALSVDGTYFFCTD